MSNPNYQVDFAGFAKAQIAALQVKAKPLGLLHSLVTDLSLLISQLEIDPLHLATMKFPQPNFPCTECFVFFKYFSVRYLVYELRNAVDILEIRVVSGHPLG